MRKLTYCYIIVIAALLWCMGGAGRVSAQDNDVEALFRRGTVRFKQGKYVSARLDFKEIISEFGSSQWAYPASMMIAKTYFYLGDYELAEVAAAELRRSVPGGRYTDWSFYIEAACRFKQGDPLRSAELLAELAVKTSDTGLRSRSLFALRSVISPVMESTELKAVLERFGISPSDIVSAHPPETFSAEGGVDGFAVEETHPREVLAWERSSSIRIGLLAPLTGFDSELGIQLLRGVRTAFERRSVIEGTEIELLVEDTESDPVTAVLKTRKLIHDGVMVIIGPVLGETTIAAATEAQSHNIPFIAPTATTIGLTRIGPSIFQLNLNPSVQAEALADFAARRMNYTTFAVIASNDMWGKTASASFSRAMEERGARSIWMELLNVYYTNAPHDILMNIRDHAPESESDLDSLAIIDYGYGLMDTLLVKKTPFFRGERKLGPIDSIDCIFVSATSEDALQLASQIMEYNIKTTILGDYGWWSNEIAFEGSQQYIEGACVVAPAGELAGGIGLRYFQETPGKPDTRDIPLMKGADALNIILYSIGQGARDPETLVRTLESIRDFQGVASLITIDPVHHTNTAVAVIRIENGRYVRIADLNGYPLPSIERSPAETHETVFSR